MADEALASHSPTAPTAGASDIALRWAAMLWAGTRVLCRTRLRALHIDIDEPRLLADIGVEPALRRDIERWVVMLLRHGS
jgi:hypothetical protein